MIGSNRVYPIEVLKQVAQALSPELSASIVIIGSLAAAYGLLSNRIGVRTKDIDCVLSPYLSGVSNGTQIAEQLIKKGWRPKRDGDFAKAGNADTPDFKLPAVRLFPPDKSFDWFLELLVEPLPEGEKTPDWTRLKIDETHHYGLPTFPFLSVVVFDARMTEFGLRCAKPEMMALGNLLEHRTIKPDLIRGSSMKRSNKDLGRVLAIAWLTPAKDWAAWPQNWLKCLQNCFPNTWSSLVFSLGDGMKALLDSPGDLWQATEICASGLLAGQNVGMEQLQLTGRRILEFVIKDLGKGS